MRVKMSGCGVGQWGSYFEMGNPFQTFKPTYGGGCWHPKDGRLTRLPRAKMAERSLFPFSVSRGEEDGLEWGREQHRFLWAGLCSSNCLVYF